MRSTVDPKQSEIVVDTSSSVVVNSVEEAINAPSERVKKIVAEILALNVLEAAQLCAFVASTIFIHVVFSLRVLRAIFRWCCVFCPLAPACWIL